MSQHDSSDTDFASNHDVARTLHHYASAAAMGALKAFTFVAVFSPQAQNLATSETPVDVGTVADDEASLSLMIKELEIQLERLKTMRDHGPNALDGGVN